MRCCNLFLFSVAKQSIADDYDDCPSHSRLRVMFRRSTANEQALKFDEDMGPEMKKTSARQKRAEKAIHMNL